MKKQAAAAALAAAGGLTLPGGLSLGYGTNGTNGTAIGAANITNNNNHTIPSVNLDLDNPLDSFAELDECSIATYVAPKSIAHSSNACALDSTV